MLRVYPAVSPNAAKNYRNLTAGASSLVLGAPEHHTSTSRQGKGGVRQLDSHDGRDTVILFVSGRLLHFGEFRISERW